MSWNRLAALLPASRPRRRPTDAIHSLDDRPPSAGLALLSAQQVATALPSLLFRVSFLYLVGVSASTLQQMI